MIRSVYIWISLLQYCFAFGPSFTSSGTMPSTLMHSCSLMQFGNQQRRETILNASNNDNTEKEDTAYEETTTMEEQRNAKGGDVGGSSKEEKLGLERETAVVGDPQIAQMETMNITKVLTELQAIQSQGPKKYCILGTRHCSFLHQQIVEML